MINYNIDPFYDDFDPTKNYHRILFKPGRAVQARELTQAQTILQNQVSQFASAIYSQNTPVSGGQVTTNLKCNFVKLNTLYSNSAVVVSNLVGQTVQDQYGIVTAKVLAASEATGNATTPGDPPTLVVSYLSGQQFTDANTIFVQSQSGTSITPVANTITTSSGGISSVASVSAGVYYVINGYNTVNNNQYSIGNFVNVLPQTVILDKYDNTPSWRIGLVITESTVTSSTDLSLLDPAAGASNYQAPGADRYQITLTLDKRPLTAGNDDAFIELLRMENGVVLKQTDQTVYSAIDDYFAKRDYETNGDYVVNDFKLTPGPNVSGNTAQYDLSIGPGVAYVRGYRIENQSNYTLTSDRARTTASITGDSNFIDYGNYFVVDTLKGIFDYSTTPSVDLHCVQAGNIVTANANTYNSTVVGTAYVRYLDYVSSTGSNTASYLFNFHVSDINTNTLSSNATSATTNTITFYDPTNKFSTAANAYFGTTLTITNGTDAGDIRTIVSYNGSTKTATVNQPFNITPDTTSQFNLIFSTGNINSIVQANTTYALTANTNINASAGKVNGVSSGATILQGAGMPEMIFTLGYPYVANVSSSSYYSTQIFRNVPTTSSGTFTINSNDPIRFQGTAGTTYSGSTDAFRQLFTVIDTANGNILDFTGNSATVVTNTQTTFTAPAYANKTVDIFAGVYVSSADSTGYVLKSKNLVVGNTTVVQTFTNPNSVANTQFALDGSGNPKGQVLISKVAVNTIKTSLYVSDVKQVTRIYDTGVVGGSPSGALAQYRDITGSFSFNNGQKDSHYSHAYIKLLPGVNPPTGDIIVVFDCYTHGGGDGYFSVRSYTANTIGGISGSPETYASIPAYTATDGTTYQLRDCVDFRPVRKNAANPTTWEYSVSTSGSIDTHGALIPQNLSNYVSNYTYYLGRKDKLVLTKDSKFSIIEGAPSLSPILPTEPTGALVLANINLDPYTAYVQGEGPGYVTGESPLGVTVNTVPSNLSIDKILHKRWAKSDITDLQTQVDNLEYYTSLSLLEQKAQTLQVPDVNGLNRFKNGILVDSFSDFGAADTGNVDYAANINIRKQQLTALSWIENFQLQNYGVLNSLGTVANTNTYAVSSLGGTSTNVYTLPYTPQLLIKQQLASNTISVNPFNVVVYEGVATLNPPMDNWANNWEAPAITINQPNLQFSQQSGGLNLLNAGDFASIPGTTVVPSQNQGVVETTYVNQLTSLNNAEASSAAAAGLIADNGYVTNTAVVPFIRQQELIVRCKGMLKNTPVGCYFDGQNVNKWITTPNTMELTGVTGMFNEDDIVGFYDTGTQQFYPYARVVSVYNYGDSSRVRLYVATTIHPPSTVATATLQNAFFDTSGNYLGKSAAGTIVPANNGALISLHNSGSVTGVGGGWTNTYETNPTYIFKSQYLSGASTFLNTYGVWGDQSNSGSYSSTFAFTATTAGTYTIYGAVTGSGTISIDGTSALSVSTNDNSTTKTLTTGAHTVSWSVSNGWSVAGFACKIVDPSGNVIWNTLTPSGLTYTNAGTEYQMPGGGSYFVGATKLQLDQNANGSSNTAFVGASVTIKSTYVYAYNYGAVYVPPYPQFSGDGDGPNVSRYYQAVAQWNSVYNQAQATEQNIIYLSSTDEFTANITSYNYVTRTVTLDRPVNVSLGYNSNAGYNITSQYGLKGVQLSIANAIQAGNSIANLSTDEHGQFVGIFNIPGSNFYTGQRVFRVDNRTVTTDPGSATTYAEAVFTAGAGNINGLAPSVDASTKTIQSVNQQSYNIVSHTSPYDPIAQTFIVSKDNYPNGVFIKSVKLFFESKSNTSPISLSVVGTINGIPNGQTLDYSQVILSPDQVNVSSSPHYLDSSTYTEFNFAAPVYIQAGTLYAFVIHSSSSDYNLYLGQQNAIAVPSTAAALPVSQGGTIPTNPTKIGAAPYVGALFESQNAITWTADQNRDLMFVIDQCVFDITQAPTLDFVVPQNLPRRKLNTQDIIQHADPALVSNLHANFRPSSPMHAFNVTTTDFVPTSTNIQYQYSTKLLNGFGTTTPVSVNPGKYGTPTQDNIYLNDGQGERILLANTNTSFQLFTTLTSTDTNVSPIISDDGISLYDIIYVINNLGIDTNKISVANTGSGYNANTMSVTISSPVVGSNSAQLGFTTNTATGAISSVYVTYPGSGYLKTPTITVTDSATRSGNANAVVTVYGETSPYGGNAYAKYITKKVVLTPGNDSGDLRVFYTAYKPAGTEVYIYYKILNASDTSKFEDQNWQLATQVSNTGVYSQNRTNLIEYEWAPGKLNKADNQISYTSTNGQTYHNFIQFAIKVVMATADNTTVPFLTDIRALALPSGTGI